jgi:3-oxoacyl-[acyl-carrier protein] reductase
MRDIRGKKALVTGAASGIGRAIAIALAREGADLFLVDIDEVGLAATASKASGHGIETVTHICDLAEGGEITAMVNTLLRRWGRLHILVNNAGAAYYGPTHAMTAAQWRRILSVNLLAPIELVHKLLPTLVAQDQAHILNVCSVFGLVTLRKGAAYQTSKFGLVGLSAALRAEYSRGGFGVTALCPGFVRTTMIETFATRGANQRRRSIPSWACLSADAVAAEAIGAIRNNRGLVVVPFPARLLWWLARLSPGLVDWLTREGWRCKRKLRSCDLDRVSGRPHTTAHP